jgi:hypothetical protein
MFPSLILHIEEEGNNQGGQSVSPEEISSIIDKSFSGENVDPELLQKIDPTKNPIIEKKEPIIPTEKKEENSLTTQEVDAYWKKLKSKLHTDDKPWDIPEEIKTGKKSDGTPITEDDKFEILLDTIYKNTEFNNQEEEDDFVKEYKTNKKNPDFDMKKWMDSKKSSLDIMSLNGKDFLKTIYANQKDETGKLKYSESDIETYLNKLSAIEMDKEVTNYKYSIQQRNKDYEQQQLSQQTEKQKKELEDWDKKRNLQVQKVINEMNKVKDIGGVPITESERKEFNTVFDNLTKYNPETGTTKMQEFLQSNETNLYKMMFLLHKVDSGSMKKYISEVKEGNKEKILEKLDIKPNIQQSANNGFANSFPLPGDLE